MSILCTILALASCLILTACSDEDEKARLLEGIVTRSALNDSLKKEIIQSEIDKDALEAISDSLSKFGDLLLEKTISSTRNWSKLSKRPTNLAAITSACRRRLANYRRRLTYYRRISAPTNRKSTD